MSDLEEYQSILEATDQVAREMEILAMQMGTVLDYSARMTLMNSQSHGIFNNLLSLQRAPKGKPLPVEPSS